MLSKQQQKNDKTEHSNKTNKVVRLHQQGLSHTNISKQMVSQDVQFKLFFKKAQWNRFSWGWSHSRWETHQAYFHFKCPVVPSVQNWQKAMTPRYNPSTVRRGLEWSSLQWVVAAKNPFLPDGRYGNKAKWLNYAPKHRTWAAEKWQQELWTDESILEIAESSLGAAGLESGTIMRGQQWDTLKVACSIPRCLEQATRRIPSKTVCKSTWKNWWCLGGKCWYWFD